MQRLQAYIGSCIPQLLFRMPCDGSCLIRENPNEMFIPCADGEDLRLYYCFHEQTHVLTNYIPAPQ